MCRRIEKAVAVSKDTRDRINRRGKAIPTRQSRSANAPSRALWRCYIDNEPSFAFFEKMSLLLGRSEYPGKNWRQRIAFSAGRAELVRVAKPGERGSSWAMW